MTEKNASENPYFVTLKNRGLIHIEGADRYEFLQNLITNDIDQLTSQNMVYACLLSAQGKFLHDFFVLEAKDFLLLDCEGGERAQDLFNRLNMYKLRSDVQISWEETNKVYAVFGSDKNGLADPRNSELGRRNFEQPDNIEERHFDVWDQTRISLCVPDGSRDMIIEKSTMDEANIETIHGVSYEKGCYVGQELTARMHYRGLGKKHLRVVNPEILQLQSLPQIFEDITLEGKVIGDMRSSNGDIGLAVLKNDAYETLTKNSHQ